MKKRIGEFLVSKGVLTPSQVDRILEHGRKTKLRFGEAALDLKVLTVDQLVAVFGPPYQTDFFNLEPAYYPSSTKDLLSTDLILGLGALPLGFRLERGIFRAKRCLNLGLLDPTRKDAVESVDSIVRARLAENDIAFNQMAAGFQEIKVFLILADQFFGILREIYGVSEKEVRRKDLANLDPTLAMYLDNIPEERVLQAAR